MKISDKGKPPVFNRRDFLAGAGAMAAALSLDVGRSSAQIQGVQQAQTTGDAIAPARRLSRGLAASFWFEWVPTSDPAAMKNHINDLYRPDDFARMRSLGFDHVRVSIQPDFLAPKLGSGDPELSEERMALFDKAMAGVLKNDLSVVLDNHPTSQMKDKIAVNDSYRGIMGQWWRNFSGYVAHQGQYAPDRTYLELLNEPEASFSDVEKYRTIIGQFISDIRASTSDYTIVVGGNNWNSPEAIFNGLKIPFSDPKLLYTFHFYKPMEFTHQALENAGPYFGKLKGVRWDVGPNSISDDEIATLDPGVRSGMQKYSKASHRKADLAWAFTQLRSWCESHNQAAWLGEFGVYNKGAPPADRAAWIRDVRELAEENGFGWALWEARGGFGLFQTGDDRPLKPDMPVLHALGL
jgi:endoglucanase